MIAEAIGLGTLVGGSVLTGLAVVKKIRSRRNEEAMKKQEEEEKRRQTEERKRTFKDYERVVWLQGVGKAGKDTILHIIKGDGFKESYPATHRVDENHEVQIANAKWKIINTGGSSANNGEKEQWRNERLKTLPQEAKKKVLWLYVFDMQEYDKDRIQASYSTSKDYVVPTFIAVGTHLDKLQAAGLDSLCILGKKIFK